MCSIPPQNGGLQLQRSGVVLLVHKEEVGCRLALVICRGEEDDIYSSRCGYQLDL